MAKTKEELNRLKEEYKVLAEKLKSLDEEELQLVTGGRPPYPKQVQSEVHGAEKSEGRPGAHFESVAGEEPKKIMFPGGPSLSLHIADE